LSAECSRFNGELIEPQFTLASLTETMFSIWPEREPAQLVDIHTRDEMMEQVLEVYVHLYISGLVAMTGS
jgi:hypothetical protein